MSTSYSTLDTAIRRATLGEGDEDKRRYVRGWVHARRWYESEYTGGVEKAYGNKSIRLEVGPDRAVDLPSDYVEYNMVGIRRGEQVHNLLHNPQLVAIPEDAQETPLSGGVQVGTSEVRAYTYCYAGLLLNGADVVGYGRPSFRPGEFSIDRATRTLLVSSVISAGQELYLSYLSDDTPTCEASLIHPLAEPWLEFYILHFLHKKTDPRLAADYWRDAERARSDYLLKRTSFQLDDLYAAMRNRLAQPI